MRNRTENPAPSRPRRWVIYCRISDDREGREYGVKRQQLACEKYHHAKLDGEIVEVLVENDTSAFSPKVRREKYARLLELLRSGEVDGVLALTSRRLQRRYREAFEFLDLVAENDIAVATVKGGSYDLTTADGRREARRKAIDDQHESEETSERVTDAKADMAEQGLWGGGKRPFGYEKDGVTIRRAEADGLIWAARKIMAGMPISAAATALAADGLRTHSGKPVDASTLRRCLINPRYIGKRVYRPAGKPKLPQAHYADDEIVGDAEWEGVFKDGNEQLFHDVRALLMDPERKIHDKHGVRVWLGTGLYECGWDGCDSRVKSAAPGGQPPSYTCKAKQHVSRQADLTDAYVRESVAVLLAELPPVTEDQAERAEELQARATGLRARLNELARQYAEELIDGEQLAAGSKPLRAQLEEIKVAQDELPRQAAARRVLDRADAVEAFLSGDIYYQRLTISTLVTVTLLPSKKGRPKGWKPGQPYFDPDTIRVLPK